MAVASYIFLNRWPGVRITPGAPCGLRTYAGRPRECRTRSLSGVCHDHSLGACRIRLSCGGVYDWSDAIATPRVSERRPVCRARSRPGARDKPEQSAALPVFLYSGGTAVEDGFVGALGERHVRHDDGAAPCGTWRDGLHVGRNVFQVGHLSNRCLLRDRLIGRQSWRIILEQLRSRPVAYPPAVRLRGQRRIARVPGHASDECAPRHDIAPE